MTLSREQEIWSIALMVEKEHGDSGPRFIAEQIGRLALNGDTHGIAMWKQVAHRYDAILSRARNAN